MVINHPQPISQTEPPESLDSLIEEAKRYLDASLAPNTKRAYAIDLREFRTWCEKHRLSWLPAQPKTLVAYLAALAKIHRFLASSVRSRRSRSLTE